VTLRIKNRIADKLNFTTGSVKIFIEPDSILIISFWAVDVQDQVLGNLGIPGKDLIRA
jgi:hypothetical protein